MEERHFSAAFAPEMVLGFKNARDYRAIPIRASRQNGLHHRGRAAL